MPKIKLNTFEGIVTNIDENDAKLEGFRDSVNFRHEAGYVVFEPRYLSEYTLPDVDVDAGDPPGTWSWETGIYSIITNDPFAIDGIPLQYRILLLVAKKIDTGIYYRKIYYKNIDSGSWKDVNSLGSISDTIFNTNRDGTVKLIADQGTIRIYLPHDSFWFGIVNRRYKKEHVYLLGQNSEGNWSFVTSDMAIKGAGSYNNFCFDRLVEKISDDPFQGDKINGFPTGADTIYIDDPLMRANVFVSAQMINGQSVSDENLYHFALCKREFFHEGYPYITFYFQVLDDSANWDGKSYLSSGDQGKEYNEFDTGSGTISPNGGPYPNGENKIYNQIGGIHQLPPGFRIPGTDTFTDEGYYNAENIASNEIIYWYDRAQKYLFAGPTDWVVTVILDDITEIVMEHGTTGNNPVNPLSPTDAEQYMIHFKYAIPANINRRVTKMNTYIRKYTYDDVATKWVPDTDYEQVASKDLIARTVLEETDNLQLEDKISINDFNGNLLSEEIGIAYETSTYKIITGFRDYAVASGIGIGVSYEDYINIYHSVVGGGNLQSDLVYTQNKLTLPGISFVNAVASVNSNIIALTDVSAYVIKPDEVAGQLVFSIQQTMNMGVKDFNDIAIIPGGLLIHTKNGIFYTSGYGESKILSMQINDIIKANYSSGTIRYNFRTNELYYRATSVEDIYRFSFERNKWEKLNATVQVGTLQPITPGTV